VSSFIAALPLLSRMRLRPYRASDISDMVTVQVKCDLEDPLALYTVKNGKMKTCPALHRHAALQFLKMMVSSPRTMAFVVEIDKNDKVRDEGIEHDSTAAPNPERIIGWAIWTRHGTDVAATKWQSINLGPGTKIEFALQLIQTRLLELWNPLIDHEHMKAVSHIMRSDFDQRKYHDYWQLEGCYVDPDWQRRGAGRLALVGV